MDLETIVKVVEALSNRDITSSYGCDLWEVGKNYFIRTVTHHLTGRLIAVTNHELWLEDAAWIADDGRFSQAIETGIFEEVEPFPTGRKVAVGRASLIDATVIANLTRGQK